MVGGFGLSCSVLAQPAGTPSISQLISAGYIDAARVQLELQTPSVMDRMFFDALVLKAHGKFPEAIKVFRRILQVDPNYINARRELAHTLMLSRDYGPARFHFEELLKIDQNDHMRNGYRGFLNAIDQNKPIGLSGFFSVLPSTNVNRGTTRTVFDTNIGQFVIDPGSHADSGVGAQLGLSGHFRYLTGPKGRLSLNWAMSGTRYQDVQYNSTVGSLAISYHQSTQSGRWFISPYIRKTLREDNADNQARGLQFGVTHRLSAGNLIGFSASHEYRDYDVLDYQDGTFTSGSLNVRHQIKPSVSVSGGVGLERNAPDAAHLQYNGRKPFAEIAKSWKGGLQSKFGLEYGVREFVGDYPLTSSPRNDVYTTVRLGGQHTRVDIRGFTPRVMCSHTINKSNVAFFEYNATECQATISKNF